MSDDSPISPPKNETNRMTDLTNFVTKLVVLGGSIGTLATVAVVLIAIIFFKRYDLINNYIPNLMPNKPDPMHEGASETLLRDNPISRSTQFLSLRPVYLDVGYNGASYVASLKQQLSNSNIQATDDRTRSGITLQVGGDVSVKPGITIGNSQTWRADAMLSLEAFGTQDHSRLFGQNYHGRDLATLPDAAREHAVAEAVRQLVADYKDHVQERRP